MIATSHHRKTVVQAQQKIVGDLVGMIWDQNNEVHREKVPVPCRNVSKGCKWVDKAFVETNEDGEELIVEESRNKNHKCPFDIILCVEDGCPIKYERRYQGRHQLFCRYHKIKCRSCGREVVQLDQCKHLEKECVKFHVYRKTRSNSKWEFNFISNKAILQAFKQSLERNRMLLSRQMEEKIAEMENKMSTGMADAKLQAEQTIAGLSNEESPDNPMNWSDEKLIKVAKKRRIKKSKMKKVKTTVAAVRKSIEAEENRKIQAQEKVMGEKVKGVTDDWREKIETFEIQLNKRQLLAEKRYSINAPNYTVNTDVQENKVGGKRRGRGRQGSRRSRPSSRSSSRPSSRSSSRPTSKSSSRPTSKSSSRKGRKKLTEGREASRSPSRVRSRK